MARPTFEVATILRDNLHRLGPLSAFKRRVIDKLVNCRTIIMGGHLKKCDKPACGHSEQSYNSCGDRHCPKCQYAARDSWIKKRLKEVLAIFYNHVVFAPPHVLNDIAITNKRLYYDLLMKTSSDVLMKLFAQVYKGAEAGIISVLHTWGQNMSFHPHAHLVIPGCGLADNDTRLEICKKAKKSKKRFLLPVKTLSKMFRAQFTKELKQQYFAGNLKFLDVNAQYSSPGAFLDLIDKSFKTDWIVYAKSPFPSPVAVLKYLSGYTHRIAISNHRITAVENDTVSFRYKDYREKVSGDGYYETKEMTLSTMEFIRRFLMHILPRGFARIRYYGFLSSARKGVALPRARELLAKTKKVQVPTEELNKVLAELAQDGLINRDVCPKCKEGKMIILETIARSDKAKRHFAIARMTHGIDPPVLKSA